MGGFAGFRCGHRRYEETGIGVGQGKKSISHLVLFRSLKCWTAGSTWVKEHEAPRCGNCYEQGVALLPDDTTRIEYPRCGKPAQFVPKDGSWE